MFSICLSIHGGVRYHTWSLLPGPFLTGGGGVPSQACSLAKVGTPCSGGQAMRGRYASFSHYRRTFLFLSGIDYIYLSNFQLNPL